MSANDMVANHSPFRWIGLRAVERGRTGRGESVDLGEDLGGELGPGLRTPARVADHARVVADDHHDLVAEVLERAQLPQADRVAEVDVGRRRVEPLLDAQRPLLGDRARELPAKLVERQDLVDAAREDRELSLDFGLDLRIPGSAHGAHRSRAATALTTACRARRNDAHNALGPGFRAC
jgi:hypothetical protein